MFIVGIIIVGGGARSEFYMPDELPAHCYIPDDLICQDPDDPNGYVCFMGDYYYHTQNEFLTCGGISLGPDGEEALSQKCEVFTPGVGWRLEPYELAEPRFQHTSWTLNNGSVVLVGGPVWSRDTTEVVTPGSVTSPTPGFRLKHQCE